ncbi:MAG: hypothetical protein R3194_13735, partial [Limnobacter sp.]|nr:hypothetical protein [Limnobacter sp.]
MINHASSVKHKVLKAELLRVSSNNAAPLARQALEQNFACFAQTGVVLGLNIPASAHAMGPSTVAFSAQAKTTMVDDKTDTFNQHLVESFAHSSQLIWLRTLVPSEASLKLGRLNHPTHLEAVLPRFNRHSWLSLLNAFALSYPVSNPNTLLRSGYLEKDGTAVSMRYSESHPDHFVLQIDAGTIPDGLTEQQNHILCMSMLQANHQYSMASGMVWSIKPDTHRAVLSIECGVFNSDQRAITEKGLHRLITQHVQLSQITWMGVIERVLQ